MDKSAIFDNACQLIVEAMEKFREAQTQLRWCGIELCDFLDATSVARWETNVSNAVIFTGIGIAEEITGKRAYHPDGDLSRKYFVHNGVTFVQHGDACKSEYVFH